MGQTLGFQGRVLWIAEASEGAGLPSSGTMRFFSDSVVSVRPSFRGNQSPARDIGDFNVVTFLRGVKEFGLTVTFRHQQDANMNTFLSDCITRQASGLLKTYAIEFANAMDSATKSYLTFKGCKPDTVELSVDEDEFFRWTITFQVLDVATSATEPTPPGTTTRGTAIGGAYGVFTGGVLTSPGGSTLAYATMSAGFTVSHNLKPTKDVGSSTVKTYSEGALDVTYKARISAADGGKVLWDAAAAGTAANAVIDTATTTGTPRYTLTATQIGDLEFEVNDSDNFMSTDIERPAKSITVGTVP